MSAHLQLLCERSEPALVDDLPGGGRPDGRDPGEGAGGGLAHAIRGGVLEREQPSARKYKLLKKVTKNLVEMRF